jgi:hypothetical protein
MRDEFEWTLFTEFPDLYWMHTQDHSHSLMWQGFSVGDGWYNIIYRLSTKIKSIVSSIPGEGVDPKEYCASQVKEKFGGLRFYMHNSTMDIEEAIREAEEETARTCETCGNPGTLNEGGWLMTLCGECREQYEREKRERWRTLRRKDSGWSWGLLMPKFKWFASPT